MNDKALTVLCLRFLDGECTPEERESLGERLVGDPSARALYRDVCRQAVWLREIGASSAQEADIARCEPPRRWGAGVLAAGAAAAVLLLAGYARWVRSETKPADNKSVASTPTAPVVGAVFLYPFDEFPVLEPHDDIRPATGPLDVPDLGEPDARVARIARHLNGLPPLPSLSL